MAVSETAELAETGRALLQDAAAWLGAAAGRVWSVEALWQALAILAAGAAGYLLTARARRALRAAGDRRDDGSIQQRLLQSLARTIWPLAAIVILWTLTAAFSAADLPYDGLRVAASLLNAWIVIRLITFNMTRSAWSKVIAVAAWGVAALYILRLLGPTVSALDAAAVEFGEVRLSALRVIVSLLIAAAALWIGRLLGESVSQRLKGSATFSPSMAGLLGQIIQIGLMAVAVVVALYSLGFNLTALTVFSGALGVGIGFGLQTVFSNFISGVIILFEKSIKVGDFIELQSGVTGLVREINIRSTLITTNDNVDLLVPNEEFIKGQVINWTLRETLRRLRVGFGVAYGSRKEVVRQAGLEAAAAVPWTYDDGGDRAPQVWLVGFGDSSLDYELVVWLTEDAVKKPARVQADYYWAIHSALEKHGIEIPFPQRDLHVKPPGLIRVAMEPGEPTPDAER